MSGAYWDVRTCSWQGGTPPQAPPPFPVRASQDVRDDRSVPTQPTVADMEPVEVRVVVTR